jgi:hypothetical protein
MRRGPACRRSPNQPAFAGRLGDYEAKSDFFGKPVEAKFHEAVHKPTGRKFGYGELAAGKFPPLGGIAV